MKIVFISLPAPYLDEPAMNPPLGICYISAYLKSKGFNDIHLVDYCLHKEYDYFNSSDYLRELPLDADVYGISAVSTQFKWLLEVCKYLRGMRPQAKIITGGPHSTNCPEDCLIDAGVDIAVVGEGEEVMYKYLSGIPAKDIPGAAYLEDGVVKNKVHAFIDNLDMLPIPDRELIDLHMYKRTMEGQRAVHIVTLRGCPYECAYCDRYSVGTNVRYRSVPNVVQEIDFIRESYGINAFVIYDDTFTLRRDRVYELSDALKERNATWRCWSRTNVVDKEMLKYIKDSGATTIIFGCESGDNRVLKRINKGTTREKNIQAIQWAKAAGLQVQCSLMYGNPGETLESIDNTVSLLAEAKPTNWEISILSPVPGSPMWADPARFGLNFDKAWVKSRYYLPCARTGTDSGAGNLWVQLDSMTPQEFVENLKYALTRLEETQPRLKDWKHYQNIRVDNIHFCS